MFNIGIGTASWRFLDTPQPDLSLEELRFLVTVAKTKSLTTAASQYGISMGAASRRLSHLREVFDDELFIRSGVTMLPTMRMRRLLPRVLDLLAAGGALLSRDNVGLADSRRIVRLLAADSAVMTVFPLLVRQMAKDAPNASIELESALRGFFGAASRWPRRHCRLPIRHSSEGLPSA